MRGEVVGSRRCVQFGVLRVVRRRLPVENDQHGEVSSLFIV